MDNPSTSMWTLSAGNPAVVRAAQRPVNASSKEGKQHLGLTLHETMDSNGIVNGPFSTANVSPTLPREAVRDEINVDKTAADAGACGWHCLHDVIPLSELASSSSVSSTSSSSTSTAQLDSLAATWSPDAVRRHFGRQCTNGNCATCSFFSIVRESTGVGSLGQVQSLPRVSGHTSTFVEGLHSVFVFGGQALDHKGQQSNELWQLDLVSGQWARRNMSPVNTGINPSDSQSSPPAMFAHTAGLIFPMSSTTTEAPSGEEGQQHPTLVLFGDSAKVLRFQVPPTLNASPQQLIMEESAFLLYIDLVTFEWDTRPLRLKGTTTSSTASTSMNRSDLSGGGDGGGGGYQQRGPTSPQLLRRWGHSMVQLPLQPGERSGANAASVSSPSAHCSTRFLVFGGTAALKAEECNDCFVFDAATAEYRPLEVTGSSRKPQARRRHVAAMLNDRIMIVHGGRHGNNFVTDLWLLDIIGCGGSSGVVWIEIFPNSSPSSVRRFVSGEKEMVSRIHRAPFFPAAAGWASSVVPIPRTGHAAFVLNEKFYIAGGFTALGGDPTAEHIFDDLLCYDINRNRWHSVSEDTGLGTKTLPRPQEATTPPQPRGLPRMTPRTMFTATVVRRGMGSGGGREQVLMLGGVVRVPLSHRVLDTRQSRHNASFTTTHHCVDMAAATAASCSLLHPQAVHLGSRKENGDISPSSSSSACALLHPNEPPTLKELLCRLVVDDTTGELWETVGRSHEAPSSLTHEVPLLGGADINLRD